jgi:hypothetical protein
MLNCIKILSKINPLKPIFLKIHNPIQFPNNKKKKKNINIISIKKADSKENLSNTEKHNQITNTNLSNESCNIIDSSASISQLSYYES